MPQIDTVEDIPVITLRFTTADVDTIAQENGIDIDVARERAESWGRHITDTVSTIAAEQLESVIVNDAP